MESWDRVKNRGGRTQVRKAERGRLFRGSLAKKQVDPGNNGCCFLVLLVQEPSDRQPMVFGQMPGPSFQGWGQLLSANSHSPATLS